MGLEDVRKSRVVPGRGHTINIRRLTCPKVEWEEISVRAKKEPNVRAAQVRKMGGECLRAKRTCGANVADGRLGSDGSRRRRVPESRWRAQPTCGRGLQGLRVGVVVAAERRCRGECELGR